MCFMMARLWPMTFSPTGMPACLQASSRQSSAARSCAKRDHERNVMRCSQTLKNDTLTYPSLWADHSIPLPFDFDVGLVHAPTDPHRALAPVEHFFQLGTVFHNPALD